jgi:hypothetical protein
MIEDLETINKWLKEEYGISYTELCQEFNSAVELSNKRAKKIERLNNIINEIDILLDKAENGWIEHLNGTVIGYQYPRECCKLRIKYIQEKIKELKGVDKE